MTTEMKKFEPEARTPCKSVGLPNNCKIILMVDNCSAHCPAEVLVKDNICGVLH